MGYVNTTTPAALFSTRSFSVVSVESLRTTPWAANAPEDRSIVLPCEIFPEDLAADAAGVSEREAAFVGGTLQIGLSVL